MVLNDLENDEHNRMYPLQFGTYPGKLRVTAEKVPFISIYEGGRWTHYKCCQCQWGFFLSLYQINRLLSLPLLKIGSVKRFSKQIRLGRRFLVRQSANIDISVLDGEFCRRNSQSGWLVDLLTSWPREGAEGAMNARKASDEVARRGAKSGNGLRESLDEGRRNFKIFLAVYLDKTDTIGRGLYPSTLKRLVYYATTPQKR